MDEGERPGDGRERRWGFRESGEPRPGQLRRPDAGMGSTLQNAKAAGHACNGALAPYYYAEVRMHDGSLIQDNEGSTDGVVAYMAGGGAEGPTRFFADGGVIRNNASSRGAMLCVYRGQHAYEGDADCAPFRGRNGEGGYRGARWKRIRRWRRSARAPAPVATVTGDPSALASRASSSPVFASFVRGVSGGRRFLGRPLARRLRRQLVVHDGASLDVVARERSALLGRERIGPSMGSCLPGAVASSTVQVWPLAREEGSTRPVSPAFAVFRARGRQKGWRS